MRDLGIYLDNPFEKIVASEDNTEKFYVDHKDRLHHLVSLGINLAHLVADTDKAVADLVKAHGSTDTSMVQLKSRTRTVDQLIADFSEKILEWETIILGKVKKKDSPIYLEFYPHGREEYHHITKGHINSLYERIITAFTNHKDLFGNEVIHEFEELRIAYNAARSNQNEQKEDKSGASMSWADVVKAMAKQAFTNLRAFADLYPNEPDKIILLFDQSIVPDSHTTKDDSTTQAGQTPAKPA